jgi:hypothetical protein
VAPSAGRGEGASSERRLAERCACPSELGPKDEQEGKQRQHQERDFHDQEKRLHESLFA